MGRSAMGENGDQGTGALKCWYQSRVFHEREIGRASARGERVLSLPVCQSYQWPISICFYPTRSLPEKGGWPRF